MNKKFASRVGRFRTTIIATLALAAFSAPAFAQQASITLVNCSNALCNANNTAWELAKTPDSQTFTGNNTITWTVTATKGATTHNFITVNGFITVKNTGTANATIGNIVVNLQKPRLPGPTPPGHPCRNVPWVSAAADVATASSGDLATSWRPETNILWTLTVDEYRRSLFNPSVRGTCYEDRCAIAARRDE